MTVKFVAVRVDDNNRITHFKTDDGRVITFEEAKQLVRQNEVDSLTEIYPDGRWKVDLPNMHEKGSNLSNLPHF